MTTYNNSYDSDGLFGDPEGDEQEKYECRAKQKSEVTALPIVRCTWCHVGWVAPLTHGAKCHQCRSGQWAK